MRKADITTTFTLVTPDMAREWIKRNTKNRAIRERWVEHLARQIKEGQWTPTTDSIGFRADGVLVNGQHRLLAIIMADRPVWMLVSQNVPDLSYKVTDRGAIRTCADVLDKPPALVADANLLAHFLQDPMHPGSTRSNEHYLDAVCTWWLPAYQALRDVSEGKHAAGFASAAVRLGFGVRWAFEQEQEARDYVMKQYKALATNNTPTMSAAGGNLWKRILKDKYGAKGYDHRLLGACVIFYSMNPKLADRAPHMRDHAAVAREMSTIIRELEPGYIRWTDGGHQGHPYPMKIAPPAAPTEPRLFGWNGRSLPDAPLW